MAATPSQITSPARISASLAAESAAATSEPSRMTAAKFAKGSASRRSIPRRVTSRISSNLRWTIATISASLVAKWR